MKYQALTDKEVMAAKAVNGRKDLYDTKPRGLMLRVSPNGAKSWSLLYVRRVDGRRRRCTLGSYPTMTLGGARDAALAILARVGKGEDPASDRQKRDADRPQTFGDLVIRYLEAHAGPNKRSGHQDEQMLKKDALPRLRTHALVLIKRTDIADVVQAVVARGAPTQGNRLFEVIRALYNWAMAQGLVETSPCLGLRAPSPEASRDRVLSPGEIRRFWFGLEGAKMTWTTAQILRLCLVTGQRTSEVAGACRSELDLAAGEWHLPAARMKNGVAHLLPLPPLAVELFREAFDRSRHKQLAFPSAHTGEPITNSAISRAAQRSLTHLKLSNFRPHDLRRTCASGMAQRRVPRLHIDKILHHISVDRGTIAGVYDRYAYRDEMLEGLTIWATALQGILSAPEAGTDNVVPLRSVVA